MSIYGALSSGVSGLFAQSSKMSAISDNIANANTVGYKRTDVPFSTLVTQQGLQHSYAAGGVRANPYMQIDRQGLLTATNSSTDLAINGSGFFVTNVSAEPDAEGLDARTLFTRAGSFRPDANGNLRNDAGLYLQGWKLESNGDFVGGEPARTSFESLETVNVTGLNFTGSPTTEIIFAGNLPAGSTGKELPGNPIVTGVEYFDPLGNPNTLNMQWTPGTTYGQWTLDLVPAGEAIPLASYEFQFHTDGPNSGAPASIREAVSNVGRITADTKTDNSNSYSGDVMRFDFDNHNFVDTDTISITIGSVPLTDFTVVGNPTGEELASQLHAHIVNDISGSPPTTTVPGLDPSGVTVSGTSITVRGLGTQEGAQLIASPPVPADNLITNGTANINSSVDTNSPDMLAGDTIEIDLEGKAALWENGDEMTITINGFSFALNSDTTPALDASSDLALATSVRDAIDAQITAGNIPGVSNNANLVPAAPAAVTSPVISITGDDSATDPSLAGTELAGRNEYAISVTRDTRQNTVFVDEDGFNVNPTETGDPIIARLGIDLPGGGIQDVDIDLGAINTLDGVTQFAGEYAPTLIERDGAQFGSLDRVEIDDGGVMNAIFNNGQVRPIYRLPVIDFVNPNGLLPVDGNAFQATAQAGAFYMWDAGSGPAGSISGSSLEASTVDIAEEFSNMIVAQRAYSSNAKIIQTADQMLQEITNLKR